MQKKITFKVVQMKFLAKQLFLTSRCDETSFFSSDVDFQNFFKNILYEKQKYVEQLKIVKRSHIIRCAACHFIVTVTLYFDSPL